MRIETVPLILGVIVALLGLGLILDARMADSSPRIERRRRTRLERNRCGELLIGIGVLGMAAAFIGRDTWRYSILATAIGVALVLIGAWMNRSYLGELLSNRGPSRRRDESVQGRPAPGAPARPGMTNKAAGEKRPGIPDTAAEEERPEIR